MGVDWNKYNKISKEEWEGEFCFPSPPNKFSNKSRRGFLKEKGLNYQDVPRCSTCLKVFFRCMCEDSNYTKKEEREVYKKHKEKIKNELNKSFEEKLEYSLKKVKYVLDVVRDNDLKMYLAYSGGIDSECCLQLYKDGIKEGIIKVIVGNTLSDLPDTKRRWKEAEEELNVNFTYATPRSGVSFRSNATKYGLPLFPRGGKGSASPTKKCCDNLKEKPQRLLMGDATGIILGIKATEGQNRRLAVLKDGDCFVSKIKKIKDGKKEDVWYVRPIAFWTADDEWKFQEMLGFEYNKIYNNTNINKKGYYQLSNGRLFQIRSGCAFCPQGIHIGYLEWLREYYPAWYTALAKMYDDIARLREGKDFYKGEPVNWDFTTVLKEKGIK
jgi:3'-phosphoadenosine 5'-phosphosulfate sulfotransferase (PAPS reductase)/FAD synthetase